MGRMIPLAAERAALLLLAQGDITPEVVARRVGISVSTAYKLARYGRLRPRQQRPTPKNHVAHLPPQKQAVWCEPCRKMVFPPCQACRTRLYMAFGKDLLDDLREFSP